jgi:hypothetical protein
LGVTEVRPVNPAIGRRRAAEFLSMNPRASLREIARKAGVSVTTARDVRQRVDKGENPLPDNLAKKAAESFSPTVVATNGAAVSPTGTRVVPEGRGRDLLQRLRNDPSVRSSERGRALLRLLSTVVVAISLQRVRRLDSDALFGHLRRDCAKERSRLAGDRGQVRSQRKLKCSEAE